MGLEDFSAVLRPLETLRFSEVEAELLQSGFVKTAVLPNILPHQVTYILSDPNKIIEALLKQNSQDSNLMDYLSLRFAICQPPVATKSFLDIITKLVEKYQFYVDNVVPEKVYLRESMHDEFPSVVIQEVRKAKSRWSKIFEDDSEEVVMTVADTWNYFREKHPKVFVKH